MGSVRERLAASAEQGYDKIEASLLEVLDANREVKKPCPKCGTQVTITTPDAAARARAAEIWLNQSFGRPKEVEDKVPEPQSFGELEAMTFAERAAWIAAIERSGSAELVSTASTIGDEAA